MPSKKKPSLFRQIKHMPGDIASKNPVRRKNGYITLLIALLVIAIVLMGVYAAVWYIERGRILNDSRRYRDMYATAVPDVSPRSETAPAEATAYLPTNASETAEPAPSDSPAPTPSAVPTSVPPDNTAVTETAVPEAEATATETLPADTPPAQTPVPMATAVPDVTIAPLATADENTLVLALPTPPPVQSAFNELLAMNSDTIGFLEIEDVIALPVVQKPNDNDYYLTHNFEKESSSEGALFLDGSNLLIPEDACLIIYGHNMKNDTMFGRLEAYSDMTFLKNHAIVAFDTLYENRSYVPFAAFSASMDKDSSHYFDVRQFVFDETSFELFTLKMQMRSIYDIPVDVRWGDDLLLLVTCDYTNTSGRFILCLRQLREDESEDALRAAVQRVKPR